MLNLTRSAGNSRSCPMCSAAVPFKDIAGFASLGGVPCRECGVHLQVPPGLRIAAILISLAIAQAADFFLPDSIFVDITVRPALFAACYLLFTWLLAVVRARGLDPEEEE